VGLPALLTANHRLKPGPDAFRTRRRSLGPASGGDEARSHPGREPPTRRQPTRFNCIHSPLA